MSVRVAIVFGESGQGHFPHVNDDGYRSVYIYNDPYHDYLVLLNDRNYCIERDKDLMEKVKNFVTGKGNITTKCVYRHASSAEFWGSQQTLLEYLFTDIEDGKLNFKKFSHSNRSIVNELSSILQKNNDWDKSLSGLFQEFEQGSLRMITEEIACLITIFELSGGSGNTSMDNIYRFETLIGKLFKRMQVRNKENKEVTQKDFEDRAEFKNQHSILAATLKSLVS